MALSETMFSEKMDKLNSTQQSIENTSSWCSLWRKDANRVVAWWETYFSKANQAKRLCMIYLANDVLQTSRKKGPEFIVEFYKVLPRALRHFLTKADDKSKASVNKVIRVWEERRVFGSAKSKTFQELMDEIEPTVSGGAAPKSTQSNKRPRSTESEGKAAIPDWAIALGQTAADVEALGARSAELKQRADAIQIPEDGYLGPEEAAMARETLVKYQTALQEEAVYREEAKTALEMAAEAQLKAVKHALELLGICEEKIEALKQAQASAPALNQAAGQGGGGEAAGVDAAEAAALAAQLMQNPQALLDAIAATMSQGGSQGQQEGAGGVGGGVTAAAAAGAAEEEYDPEDW